MNGPEISHSDGEDTTVDKADATARDRIGDLNIQSFNDFDYKNLKGSFQRVEQDFQVTIPEVIPGLVDMYRIHKEKLSAQLAAQQKLLLADPKPETVKRIQEITEQFRIVNDRLAQVHATWFELLLHLKYQSVFRNLKGNISTEDLGALSIVHKDLEEREKTMNEHVERIMKLMKQRASLATVIMLENVSRIDEYAQATSKLSGAVEAYNHLTGDTVPQRPDAQSDLTPRSLALNDTLRAELNFTSPEIVRMFTLYHRFLRSEKDSVERKDILSELRDASVRKPDDTDDVRDAKRQLETFLETENEEDARIAQDSLPTSVIEGVELTADVLIFQIDQLMARHQIDDLQQEDIDKRLAARKALVQPLEDVLDDLEQMLYLRGREMGGWEHIRARFSGNVPETDQQAGKLDPLPGYSNSLRQMALRDGEALLKSIRGAPDATTGDQVGAFKKRLIDAARRIMRKIDDLDKILKTDEKEEESVKDILKADDEANEKLAESVELRQLLLANMGGGTDAAHPEALPEALVSARQNAVSTADIMEARKSYEEGTARLSQSEVSAIITRKDPAEMVLLWHKLDAQILGDLGRHSDVRRSMFRSLIRTADVGEQKELEQRLVTNKVKERVREGAGNAWDAFRELFKQLFGFDIMWIVVGGATLAAGSAYLHARSMLGLSGRDRSMKKNLRAQSEMIEKLRLEIVELKEGRAIADDATRPTEESVEKPNIEEGTKKAEEKARAKKASSRPESGEPRPKKPKLQVFQPETTEKPKTTETLKKPSSAKGAKRPSLRERLLKKWRNRKFFRRGSR